MQADSRRVLRVVRYRTAYCYYGALKDAYPVRKDYVRTGRQYFPLSRRCGFTLSDALFRRVRQRQRFEVKLCLA